MKTLQSSLIGSGMVCLAFASPALAQNCPGVGDCCEVHLSPGCTDEICCSAVCAIDPTCCTIGWDQVCVNLVPSSCGGEFCGPICGDTICEPGETFPECPECPPVDNCPGVGDCCEVHASPGCTDASCCDSVCRIDPFCCENGWDQGCVNLVATQCAAGFCDPVCGDGVCERGETFPECRDCPPVDNCPGVGDCCEAHASPGCTDEACCNSVCAVDPFCCESGWDQGCVNLASAQCDAAACGPICGDAICEKGEFFPECPECPPIDNCPGVGDCCAAHASPGCTDEACCNAVCAADPSCCNTAWDQTCVALAGTQCDGAICGPVCGDSVCEPGETFPECPECPPTDVCPSTGDCCEAHAGPGCNVASCCDAVCAADPSCCAVAWDEMCAGEAFRICSFCDITPTEPADLDGDGSVGSADLAMMLGAWGGSGAADLDGDGVVGAGDLAMLLGAWS